MVIDFEKIAEAHYMENLTDHDLVYLAIVPEHH